MPRFGDEDFVAGGTPPAAALAALLMSEEAAPYLGRDRDARWDGVVDVRGRLVVTDSQRTRAYVLAAEGSEYSLSRHADLLSTLSDESGVPLFRGTLRSAFGALVEDAGMPARPGGADRDDDRLTVAGHSFSLEREVRSDRKVRVRIHATKGNDRGFPIAPDFLEPWEAGRVLDAWLGAGGVLGAYEGLSVECRNLRTGEADVDTMRTPGEFVARFGCMDLPVGEVVARYEAFATEVLLVTTMDGTVLYEREPEATAGPSM